MNNYEKIKNMTIEEMAGFIRMDILSYLECWRWNDDEKRICIETGNECQFACLKRVEDWLQRKPCQ